MNSVSSKFSRNVLNAVASTIFLCLATSVPSVVQGAENNDSNDTDAKASKTTVFISVPYFDANTSTVKTTTEGSGLIISSQGDILTDFHVVKDWLLQDQEHRQENPISVRIGSIFEIPLEAAYETSDKDADLAIIKIRKPGPYSATTICYVSDMPLRARLTGYGFPKHHELTPVDGTFSNAGGDDNRWEAAIPVQEGMSGGPVYDSRGFVVGVVKAGAYGSTTTNVITPIKWGRSIIEARTDAKPACFASCELPQHGVARWANSSPWHDQTGWLGGGHNQSAECGNLQAIYMQTHPNEALDITGTSERNSRDFLGHVTYQYYCDGVVRSGPTYAIKEDAACPR